MQKGIIFKLVKIKFEKKSLKYEESEKLNFENSIWMKK